MQIKKSEKKWIWLSINQYELKFFKESSPGLYESISCLNSNEIFDINFGAKSKNINNINKQGVKFVDLNKNSIIEEIKFSEEEQILKALYGLDKGIFSISDARLTFIKGLWIIKEREKRKEKN